MIPPLPMTQNQQHPPPRHQQLPHLDPLLVMESGNGGSTSGSDTLPGSGPRAAALLHAQRQVKHKRRYCRYLGCTRIVKSQGLCQRHGARPRKCRVADCIKQAQGNFDGMCKSHFKAFKRETTPLPRPDGTAPSGDGPGGAAAVPESVYDHILPQSVAWHSASTTTAHSSSAITPLIRHLADGFAANKPPAWHRNEERMARGLVPVSNAALQLEGWERELVWMEILALSGNPDASFRHLARAWGRDKGFHMVLAQFICERRGDVERKKRERQVVVNDSNNNNRATSTEPDLNNVWEQDVTTYGDVYDEALASDLLSFSQQLHGGAEGNLLQKHVSFQSQTTQHQQLHPHRDSFDQAASGFSNSPITRPVIAEDIQLLNALNQHNLPQQHNARLGGDLYSV